MLVNLQALRAVAALSVVLYHAIGGGDGYGMPVVALRFAEGWSAAGVDLFFVISGFVMTYVQARRPRSPARFALDRATRIVPLYWGITFALCAVVLALPETDFGPEITPGSVVLSLGFASEILTRTDPIVYVGWTLEYEMLFYAVFALGIALGGRGGDVAPRIVPVGMILALVSVGAVRPMALEFGFGMALAWMHLRLPRAAAHAALLIVATGTALGAAWFVGHDEAGVRRVLAWGVPAAALVVAGLRLPPSRSAALRALGDAFYAVYLVQVVTVPLWYKLAVRLAASLPADAVALGCIGFTMAAGVAVHRVVEVPLLRRVRRVTAPPASEREPT